VRKAHEQYLETGWQVEVDELRIWRVDCEGVLAVARNCDELAWSCRDGQAPGVESAMAAYDVETLVLSVGVRARAASVRHDELVKKAK